ncbi:MAG: hypothetical protein JXR07_00495 [Reichenbachiella sp.]
MRTVFEAPDATFEVDEIHSIFSFSWNGIVSEKSVKRVMTLASKSSAILEDVHWFIDRRNLEGYSPEARIWLKNEFVNEVGKELISKTDRIAAVNSDSPMSKLSSNVLIDALKKINSDIDYQEFDIPKPALNWLQNIIEDVKPSKKKRRFFGRKK